jgi:hypothetical protein
MVKIQQSMSRGVTLPGQNSAGGAWAWGCAPNPWPREEKRANRMKNLLT